MESFWIILVVAAVAILHFFEKRREKERKNHLMISEEKQFSDENVFKAISDFEENMKVNVDLPDGIRRRDAYIFRHLVAKWYIILVVQLRYDTEKKRLLNKDVLKYIFELENKHTLNLLSTEGDEAKREDWSREANKSRQTCEIIENALLEKLRSIA